MKHGKHTYKKYTDTVYFSGFSVPYQQLVARRLAVRQARVSRLGTTGRSFPLSLQAMRRWREASANGDGQILHCIVLYECDECDVIKNMKNIQKEWHPATKL
jgi:hypothetical protein